jgi:hypothetical protein
VVADIEGESRLRGGGEGAEGDEKQSDDEGGEACAGLHDERCHCARDAILP